MDHQCDQERRDVDGERSRCNVDTAMVDATSPGDQLERYGRWLSSIPRDDVIALRETQEYHDFFRAFERLGHAHRRVISVDRTDIGASKTPTANLRHNPDRKATSEGYSSYSINFLQHVSADDVVLRVLEFLECRSLIRTAFTCTRFRQLAYRSATQRTYDVASTRQLHNVMQLLRAKEQIEGVGVGIHENHVRIPILLLNRRVLVTNAGDPEMNGVYFCTECNGNGFVFTKPRYPEQRIERQQNEAGGTMAVPGPQVANHPMGILGRPVRPNGQPVDDMEVEVAGPPPLDQTPSARFESAVAQPGQLLRCFIAKRFSNEVSTRCPVGSIIAVMAAMLFPTMLKTAFSLVHRQYFGISARKWWLWK